MMTVANIILILGWSIAIYVFIGMLKNKEL